MMQRQNQFNPKRRLKSVEPEEMPVLVRLSEAARYGGNPEHKRHHGDFSLMPPASPRRGKSLCDDVKVFARDVALGHLREGIIRGFVDSRWSGEGWPQLVWAVTPLGPVEAQHEGEGVYHGYPMPQADPLYEVVVKRWAEVDEQR